MIVEATPPRTVVMASTDHIQGIKSFEISSVIFIPKGRNIPRRKPGNARIMIVISPRMIMLRFDKASKI